MSIYENGTFQNGKLKEMSPNFFPGLRDVGFLISTLIHGIKSAISKYNSLPMSEHLLRDIGQEKLPAENRLRHHYWQL